MTRNCLNVMRKLAAGIKYNPAEHDIPRSWFDNAGYTEDEYNKYKGRGYSLHPVTRENMIHNWIDWDRKVNKMRQYAESTGQPTDNMAATFSRGRMTQFNGQPVIRSSNPPAGYSTANPVAPNGSNTATAQSPTVTHRHPVAPTPVSGTRNSVNYRTDGVPIDEHVFDRWRATPAERNKYRYEFQNLPYNQRNTAVFEAIHKDRRANKTARYKEIVDGSFNKDQSPSYMPLEDNPIDDPSFNGEDTPVSAEPQENSYKDTKERQEVLSTAQTQDKGLDMSDMPGFSGLEYKAPESLNRIPASLRGTGWYTPSPSKLPESDINDMFSGGPDTSYSGFKSPEVGNTEPQGYKQPEAVQGLQHVLQEVTQPSQPVDTPKPTVEAPKAPEAPKYPQASVKDTTGDGVFRPKDAVEAQYYTKKEIAPGVRSLRVD